MYLIRSGAIDGFEDLVSGLGQNAVTLLSEVGLSSPQLRNPNTYISYSKVADLLEQAATCCDEPLFGLLLTRLQTSSVLGELAVSVFQEPTVAEALNSVAKYLYLHARGARVFQRKVDDRVQIFLAIHIGGTKNTAQLMQLSVGQLANFIAELLGQEHPRFPLLIQQAKPIQDSTRLEKSFLGRVKFSSQINGVSIPAQWMERKPHVDEEALRLHFKNYLQSLQERYPDSLTDQVREIIGQMLPSGDCTVERVAATLGMHVRVLQMQLKKHGATYRDLLQETRLELATQHLALHSTEITELALHLGYAEVSVFSRSFKHWTGLSPHQWQLKHCN
jgi:AraC-like DNA-binding protein